MSNPNLKPTLLFIFGGSGDLTNRKLIPALYNLYIDNYLPEKFSIIGIGRETIDNTDYHAKILQGLTDFSRRKPVDDVWLPFKSNLTYYAKDLLQDSTYSDIQKIIGDATTLYGTSPVVIFYLAVAPSLAPQIAKKLGQFNICADPTNTRLVFEKPFGKDLQSARELNLLLTSIFEESQIYRIDHYLGKDTVQNILAYRFANVLFEPIWNSNYIDHVQITVAETVGVGDRGSYYEQAGALRDMVQNHVLQLLCMVAMEPPSSFEANEIRNKKLDVLNSIRRIAPEDVHKYIVRGQYEGGWMEGKEVLAYRSEKNVDPQSAVETFVAAKFYVDNWRWQQVPFYVRSGKYMHERSTLITIQFKDAPRYAFPASATETWRANRLMFSIQPNMDIRIRFQAKKPGPDVLLNPVDMVFNYAEAYPGEEPEAYETLLEDVIMGDPTLFMRADQVESAWSVIMPILETWQRRPPDGFPNYAPGSWGPEDSDALIAKDGHHWVKLPTS